MIERQPVLIFQYAASVEFIQPVEVVTVHTTCNGARNN